MMYEEFFSERLVKLRMQKGVSARDMSLSLGQSENYINMIENKKNLPSMAMFFNICEYLNISPSDFFEYNLNNPVKSNQIMDGLSKLDDTVLEYLYGIVKELAKIKK
ncbi:hypothetical protein acsn021_06190 [Anaerocolumna cellulosilytica]|uniref:Uncharacterized protein n=2 Tax=Anaerocolumna cellulosilytica TaxID=433286 RepID=A0A6S6R172_9FIRM|nr:transcriptional regulator with XRE-family HTH domain [Anaerocolumna cellulosilytica]BCJ93050.1 hypothetical protein acsn021_06190 [Anaerocolumna cellulosilytica]